jgi:hypothetical protein
MWSSTRSERRRGRAEHAQTGRAEVEDQKDAGGDCERAEEKGDEGDRQNPALARAQPKFAAVTRAKLGQRPQG